MDPLTQIKNLIVSRNYLDAIAHLEKILETNYNDLTACFYLVLTYILLGEPENAEAIWLSFLLDKNSEETDLYIAQLRSFLEEQFSENLTNENLENAKNIYQVLQSLSSEYQNTELLNELEKKIIALADNLTTRGHHNHAAEVYQEAIALGVNDPFIWYSLALNHWHLEEFAESEKYLINSISNNACNGKVFYLMGKVSEKLGKIESAIKYYKKSILEPSSPHNYYLSLADILIDSQKWTEAIEAISTGLKNLPNNGYLLMKIGEIYQGQGNLDLANYYLGYGHYYSGESGSLHTALPYLEKFYQNNLYNELKNFRFYEMLANAYAMSNLTEESILILQKMIELFPERILTINRLILCCLPVLYINPKQIQECRKRFAKLLVNLIQDTDLKNPVHQQDVIRSFLAKTNFYLGYQNKNDLLLQKMYGNYVYQVLQKALPHWTVNIEISPPYIIRKIKVGIVSYRMQGLGLLYLGWLKYINKNKFEINTYYLLDSPDDDVPGIKDDFKEYSDNFTPIVLKSKSFNEYAQKIRDDNLDVLIYPEIGMDPFFTLFTNLRLAPIQCTTWAHPITSGSFTIDYFLSSDLMEPEDGDKHYSEQLVKLPNIGFSLPPVHPPIEGKSRLDFNLSEEKIIYFCSQSLFKYLPQHDYIFPAIAQVSKKFEFVFLDPMHGQAVTDCFRERLRLAFEQYALDYEKYCKFLPRLNNLDFVRLNTLADIFLDCLSWSGGLTTRHAIGCGLPIVTCPGKFMRSRHSYGMLKMIGVTETIATNAEQYIEIAVRLGTDSIWREEVNEKMESNKHKLFDDQLCILSLENFFQDAVVECSRHNNNL
ncbi:MULTISPECIES: tetratricopeptide repeat protein [unclassified Synechocystis]|uniref:tetratricopeptide repeat protein n=1 Tax=unclassified Synechocystis TaxID=2640012 RepID=UPI0006905A08|nr:MULTISPECIES: tetratricopeptide repeat protein [unclassified Synechocystis]MCT0255088.1 tetratricopeptide repeat protein [Synechocystis sp. CS-94]